MKDGDEPRVSLSLLEIFGGMMRCRTTVEAADQLGISQPAVSNGLRQLERELGITIVERAHRRLEPTAEVGIALALDHHRDVNVEVLHRIRMVALLPAEAPPAALPAVTARDAARHPVVGLEAASRPGQILRGAFDRDGAVYDPRVEVRYCFSTAVLAKAGLGLSVVGPHTASVDASPNLVRRPFSLPCEISVSLLLRKGVPHSRLVTGFVAELRRRFRGPPPD